MDNDGYIKRLIDRLGLEPLPNEGGLYVQTYRSPEEVPEELLPAGCRGSHPMGTAILYLYLPGPSGFSALHALPSDEIYHFYSGDPVGMLLLDPDGNSRHVVLGPDLLEDQHVQYAVPRGTWQGSRLLPGGRYALAGTTMAPGFSNADYRCGRREELVLRYPREREAIIDLTREMPPDIDNPKSRS